MAVRDQKAPEGAWLAYEERAHNAFRAYYAYLPKGKSVVNTPCA
jgi:hypothetical protein